MARIKHHGKNYYLGTFDTVEEAQAVRDAAAAKLFTHDDGQIPN